MTVEAQQVNVNSLWREHCRNAVRKFVMHAVVIDNQPVLAQKEETAPTTAETATLADEGMGDDPTEQTPQAREETADVASYDFQDLNVREVSDAFAENEIACAFVFPEDKDIDEEKIFRRAMAASIPADIVVIDWYLRDKTQILRRKY